MDTKTPRIICKNSKLRKEEWWLINGSGELGSMGCNAFSTAQQRVWMYKLILCKETELFSIHFLAGLMEIF